MKIKRSAIVDGILHDTQSLSHRIGLWLLAIRNDGIKGKTTDTLVYAIGFVIFGTIGGIGCGEIQD